MGYSRKVVGSLRALVGSNPTPSAFLAAIFYSAVKYSRVSSIAVFSLSRQSKKSIIKLYEYARFSRASIEKTRASFPSQILKTPLEKSERLSKKYNANVYLKREDTQIVRSYKIRGAYNLISSLAPEERKKGVVCASAGQPLSRVRLRLFFI